MKNKLTLGFLLWGITLFGQEYAFDIHNVALEEYIQMEKRLGGKRIPAASNFVFITGDAQPIQFLRKERIIPDLMAYYFYRAKDSMMTNVLYEWDESHSSKIGNRNKKKQIKVQKALTGKFNDLHKEITQIYGEPKTKGDVPDVTQVNIKDDFTKKYSWYPNDSTEIELNKDFYKERGIVTTAPYHRIRLSVRNIKKEKRENKLDTLINLSSEFLQALAEKELAKSRIFLADSISETVTDEQIRALMDNLDSKRETELVYIQNQPGRDGSVFAMLQFEYKEDTLDSQNETIKIIFDYKNKIVGIQQINRK